MWAQRALIQSLGVFFFVSSNKRDDCIRFVYRLGVWLTLLVCFAYVTFRYDVYLMIPASLGVCQTKDCRTKPVR